MARYKTDHRETLQFLSGSLDSLLPQNSFVRLLWAGLERLDFSRFDEVYSNDARGRSAINPRCLVAVWMLGLLRGITSSVRLAALCGQDLEFRWLVGDCPVEKSTLSDFRKQHKEALVSLSAQVLVALGENGLLPGENMGVDGTIVRAASSRKSVRSRREVEKRHGQLTKALSDKLSGEEDDGQSTEAILLERRLKQVEKALERMEAHTSAKRKEQVTLTEPDASMKRQKDGSYAPGHNVQAVIDMDSGVIVHAEVIDAANDAGQLAPVLEQARAALAALGKPDPDSVTADGAYHDTFQLHRLENEQIQCYVPDNRNENRHVPGIAPEYSASHFSYDEATDTMRCPEGATLKRRKLNNAQTAVVYEAGKKVCDGCPAKARCCPETKSGRSVNRPLYTDTLETIASRLATPQGEQMLRKRWAAGEGAFARLKHILHWPRCRTWGREGAAAELLWRQLTHNLMLLIRWWQPIAVTTMATA